MSVLSVIAELCMDVIFGVWKYWKYLLYVRTFLDLKQYVNRGLAKIFDIAVFLQWLILAMFSAPIMLKSRASYSYQNAHSELCSIKLWKITQRVLCLLNLFFLLTHTYIIKKPIRNQSITMNDNIMLLLTLLFVIKQAKL